MANSPRFSCKGRVGFIVWLDVGVTSPQMSLKDLIQDQRNDPENNEYYDPHGAGTGFSALHAPHCKPTDADHHEKQQRARNGLEPERHVRVDNEGIRNRDARSESNKVPKRSCLVWWDVWID